MFGHVARIGITSMLAAGTIGCGAPGNVHQDAMYEVAVTEDVVFGQGLARSSWEADDAVAMDLLLDVYQPTDESLEDLPVVVLIHGGGFKGGTHKKPELVDMGYHFAERGWVAFSIDYRVLPNFGPLPEGYPAAPEAMTTELQRNQWKAFYPACRDAKAAVRWIRANAEEYRLDTGRIAAIGGSAGSFLSVALGVTNDDDCVTEIPVEDDPTLASTHLEESSSVDTIIDHWGGPSIVRMLEALEPGDRFDATDAPISIVHGKLDPTVPFSEAEALKAEYDETGVPYAWYPLENAGHGPWEAEVDGKSLSDLAFDFIVEHQDLTVD